MILTLHQRSRKSIKAFIALGLPTSELHTVKYALKCIQYEIDSTESRKI